MAVNETLMQGAEEIRDASAVGENTALRVGTELVGIVNELGNKADGDLSEIAADISAVKGKINEVIAELAGIAFVGAKPSLLGDFAWDDTVRRITLADGVEHLELSGTLIGTTFTGTISVIAADASTHGLPFPEDVTATMLGADKAVTYDEVTGAITINGVTADVEITAIATELHGYIRNDQSKKIRWRIGKYYGLNSAGNAAEMKSAANAAYSDFIPLGTTDDYSPSGGETFKGSMGAATIVANDSSTQPQMRFSADGINVVSKIGQNTLSGVGYTFPTGTAWVANMKYIVLSAYCTEVNGVMKPVATVEGTGINATGGVFLNYDNARLVTID